MSEKYPLQPVLDARTLRERNAAAAVSACKRAVEEAEKQLENSEQKLEEHIQWRKEQAANFHAKIAGSMCNAQRLAEGMEYIRHLPETDIPFQQKVEKARTFVEQAQSKVEQALERHRQVAREKIKLEKHRDIWRKEQKKRQEKAAELELENYHPPLQDDDDSLLNLNQDGLEDAAAGRLA